MGSAAPTTTPAEGADLSLPDLHHLPRILRELQQAVAEGIGSEAAAVEGELIEVKA